MTIEIDNRLYKNITQWCQANGIDTDSYIEKALTERFTLDKYGDLNDKIVKSDNEDTTKGFNDYDKTEPLVMPEPTTGNDIKPEVTEQETKLSEDIPVNVAEQATEETTEETTHIEKPKKRKLISK